MMLRKAVFKSDKEKDLSRRKDLGDKKREGSTSWGRPLYHRHAELSLTQNSCRGSVASAGTQWKILVSAEGSGSVLCLL